MSKDNYLKTAKNVAKELGKTDVKYLGKWNNYECYHLVRNDNAETGYPVVLLFDAKGRMKAAGEEVFEILDHFYPNDDIGVGNGDEYEP